MCSSSIPTVLMNCCFWCVHHGIERRCLSCGRCYQRQLDLFAVNAAYLAPLVPGPLEPLCPQPLQFPCPLACPLLAALLSDGTAPWLGFQVFQVLLCSEDLAEFRLYCNPFSSNLDDCSSVFLITTWVLDEHLIADCEAFSSRCARVLFFLLSLVPCLLKAGNYH